MARKPNAWDEQAIVKTRKSLKRSIGLGCAVLLGLIVYAYGFNVTKVNFETTRSEVRLTQLTRILRALAHPNILEYEKDELHVEVAFYLPCPDEGVPETPLDTSGPYVVLNPPCGEAKEIIEIEGHSFWPNVKGPINFIPLSGAKLTIGHVTTDADGDFSAKVELPNRQPVVEAQTIRTTVRRNVGLPHFSQVALSTWDKIIETVFLALLATTFGTILAIPMSFLAARNLMSSVRTPLTSIALSILGWLAGFALSVPAAGWINQVGESLQQHDNSLFTLGGVIAGPVVAWVLARWAMPQEETERPSSMQRSGRLLAILAAAVCVILSLRLLANLGIAVGNSLMEHLGPFAFLGNFLAQLGDSLRMILPLVIALAAGGLLSSVGGGFGEFVSNRLATGMAKGINLIAAAIAGAALFASVGALVNWFYQFEDPLLALWIPIGAGSILGAALALRASPKEALPMGTIAYTITRTLLNAIRSIEPLIMVIVFVVWVGIGPFAGSLALALHTIAALAKLYSEQVESILPGPLEAVQATGANRLQTIMYAVIPQIVPPYISFTMYRWDINVRMSTIIGFAGGGGIGFLLQQNINLLDYRAASVQMLAIAVVVGSMDYISSDIRRRFV
jgi:phosphonate ABC transporter permease subunit PhnE